MDLSKSIGNCVRVFWCSFCAFSQRRRVALRIPTKPPALPVSAIPDSKAASPGAALRPAVAAPAPNAQALGPTPLGMAPCQKASATTTAAGQLSDAITVLDSPAPRTPLVALRVQTRIGQDRFPLPSARVCFLLVRHKLEPNAFTLGLSAATRTCFLSTLLCAD